MSRIGQAAGMVPSDRTVAHEHAPRSLVGFAQDYPAGFTTGWHVHVRTQLLYATRGVLRVEADGAAFLIPPATGLFVPANVPHAVRMDGEVAMRALFLREDAARSGPSGIAVVSVSPLLRELILAACAEPLEWDPDGRGGHLAALAVDEIARARALPLALPAPHDPRLRRLTSALRSHPGDPRGLDALAVECGASVRTLARLFRRETGMSFQQWRRQLRLTEGLARLATGVTPARAAAAVGYASASAFGAAFRECFGSTPGQVRTRD